MKEGTKIKRSVIFEMLKQNEAMRELLQTWPPREIMMDYEKTWNEKREEFLRHNPPLQIDRA